MAFADKLKKLREEHGLSQAALAKRIYVSRSAVAKWENGLGLPDDGNLQALCGYFNVPHLHAQNNDLARALSALAVCDDLRDGPQSAVPLFPQNEGHGDRIVFFRRRLGGNGGVSVLALALPALRAKSRLCFFLEIGLTILSAALFLVLFVGVYLIVTPIYDFPPSL